MIANSVMNNANICREIGWTLGTVWIEEEKGMVNSRQSAPSHGPIHDGVVFLRRVHVCYILGVVDTSHRWLHANELPFLGQDIPYISSLTDS